MCHLWWKNQKVQRRIGYSIRDVPNICVVGKSGLVPINKLMVYV